jgi:hypothetical protein
MDANGKRFENPVWKMKNEIPHLNFVNIDQYATNSADDFIKKAVQFELHGRATRDMWMASEGMFKLLGDTEDPLRASQEYQDKVIELNRLCRTDDLELPLSQFVAGCLRLLSGLNLIVVSYSDSAMNHHGYIYQACNFLYTGKTLKRTDKYTEGNKHSRHYDNAKQNGIRKVRSAKYRYVYFATENKRIKKLYLSVLKYPILPYPKGDNENYVLGEYLAPELVNSSLDSKS